MSKRIYFLSDCHFGAQDERIEQVKQQKFFQLLELVRNDGLRLYLLGDIFDYWFEYRYSIPALYFDIFCELKATIRAGVEIVMLGGNHDFWGGHFLEKEIGIRFYHKPIKVQLLDYNCFLAHGDALVDGCDYAYKNIFKPILSNRILIEMFKLVHPDIGVLLAKLASSSCRLYHPEKIPAIEREFINFAQELLERYDAVVLGHLHLPKLKKFDNGIYLNVGNWFRDFSFGTLDTTGLHLNYLTEDKR